MDSLTQMVLGAACGEAVLGKKIGNRALIWGAFGGSLPDFDVLSNLFTDPLSSLVFHRGPMHSLTFAFIMPFILAAGVRYFYASGFYSKVGYRWFAWVLGILLYGAITFIVSIITFWSTGIWAVGLIIVLILFGAYFFKRIFSEYVNKFSTVPETRYWDFVILFFVAIVTHPILDCFTTFGTQLFWPFSSYRVSCSNISIADPLYTIPFLLCVIGCSFFRRTDKWRSYVNTAGLYLSSGYMIFTIMNQSKVEKVFKDSFNEKNIHYEKLFVSPTILNNMLWFGIAKTDTTYYCGYYSLLDASPQINNVEKVNVNYSLIAPFVEEQNFRTLRWFSSEYYNVLPYTGDTLQYNDLRFGSMSFEFKDPQDYIFHFKLLYRDGVIQMLSNNERPKQDPEQVKLFWKRVRGI